MVMVDRSSQKRHKNCEVSRGVRRFEWGEREGMSTGLMLLKLRSLVSIRHRSTAVATTAQLC